MLELMRVLAEYKIGVKKRSAAQSRGRDKDLDFGKFAKFHVLELQNSSQTTNWDFRNAKAGY